MTELIDEQYDDGWTVAQLIAFLQRCPPDMIVVLSKDAEGNLYSPLRTTGTTYYVAETRYSGFVDDDATDQVPVVSLWPVN